MATGKRYYWIKLKDSFMTSDAVDFLMSQPDGANYVVLYQILCLKTINTEGKLERHIGEIIIPYDEAKIQRDAKWFTIDTVRVALNLYKNLGLVYEDQNGVLTLADYDNLVGSETDWAKKKKKQRDKTALPSGDNVPTNVHENVPIDNRDKRIEKDKRDRERKKIFVPPTLEEVKAYIAEKGYHVDGDFFWNYYDKGEWKRKDGTPVLNWKQTLVTWEKKESAEKRKPETNNIFAQIYEEEYGR